MAGFDHLDLITIVGQAVTLDQKPAKGKVTFATSTQLTDQVDGQAIFPVALTVQLDATGAFSTNLPATNDPDISPIGWVYNVTVDVNGSQPRTFELAVPYDTVGPIDLFSAAPIDGSGVVYVPQPTADDLFGFALLGVV